MVDGEGACVLVQAKYCGTVVISINNNFSSLRRWNSIASPFDPHPSPDALHLTRSLKRQLLSTANAIPPLTFVLPKHHRIEKKLLEFFRSCRPGGKLGYPVLGQGALDKLVDVLGAEADSLKPVGHPYLAHQ